MTPIVFVGAPAVLTHEQDRELARWTAALAATGLLVARLDRRSYGPNPWQRLREQVDVAAAVAVLGFRQLSIQDGVWRPGTGEQAETDHGHWTTPWVQIEAGMAVASGLPLLVVAEEGVSEGACHPDVWQEPVFGTRLHGDPSDPSVQRWRSSIDRRERDSERR